MIALLLHPVFGRLYAAQVIALIGTGLLSVALGLLAYDLAGADAARVLGTAYAIKMVAYVGLSPVAGALIAHLPRKPVLIGADLIRAAVALSLPFITQTWQIYLAIFVLQTASAAFTPAFQATIPDVLPDEDDYARALSLSRLAYDLENLASPALAALLLILVSYHWLFAGTVLGFVASALLVRQTDVPPRVPDVARPFRQRLTRGLHLYLATPRLRGLWWLTLTAASTSAFVIVNTVVMVRAGYGGTESGVAAALAAYGAGAMTGALALPRLLGRWGDRPVMFAGAGLLTLLLLGHAAWSAVAVPPWPAFVAIWALNGIGYAMVLTPSGRLLRRSAHAADRPALFTAQFALSHMCWLITYPVAGWTMTAFGPATSLAGLALLAAVGVIAARRMWPSDPLVVAHTHAELAPDHPHLRGTGPHHAHAYVIDDAHHHWPTHG